MNPPSTTREVERKFRVHESLELPDFVTSGVAPRAERLEPYVMEASYHDTEELTLLRWGVTLRRREGGPDEGWHMKLPVAGADGSTRDELHLPLDAGGVGSVPGALVQIVAPLLHDLPLVPLATVTTRRTPVLLTDGQGRLLAEVVDDVVTVTQSGRTVTSFREIEVEAARAEEEPSLAALDAVATLLLGLGAQPSSTSKAAVALGPRAAQPPDVPDRPAPGPGDLAVDAITAVLSQHVRHLLMADIAVRRDLPDSVHQMRVAARRLRSALATFAPLLEPGADQALREELRWLASELGAIRDTEVMLDRLDRHAGELEDPRDTDRARSVIDPLLTARLSAARSSAVAALRSDRHQLLVDDLMVVAVDPPVSDLAYRTCAEVMLPLVARTWKRLRIAVDALELDSDSSLWHTARIRAKQARYAADAVVPIFGTGMDRYARRLAEVTELLGDHQDAHVAQAVLRELATHDDVTGQVGLSLGVLHEFEVDEELLLRYRFTDLWPKARRAARRAGVT